MGKTQIAILVAALVSMLGACGGAPGPDQVSGQETLAVSLSLPVAEGSIGGPCDRQTFGSLYFGVPESQVTIRSEDGTTVGVGRVPAAGVIEGPPSDFFIGWCVFQFDVDVDSTARFYEFEIGDLAGPTVSRADLEADSWAIAITP